MRKVVSLGAFVLLLLVGLGPATAEHTFSREYAATSMVAWGNPHEDNTFIGTGFCQNGRNAPTDTAGCFFYRVGSLYDLRGARFTVTVDDLLFGGDTWALVVVHTESSSLPDCARDACFFGQGTIQGEIPADADGSTVRVIPLTLYATEALDVPQGFASNGTVTIRFHETL